MIWLSMARALAATIPLADASDLGPASRHQLVAECDCVRAIWDTSAGEVVVDVPRNDITAVVQTATPDGQQEVSLRTKSGAALLLQRAPCAPSTWLASSYSALLQVSQIGDAADDACADLIGAVAAWEDRRFEQVEQLKVALVSVTVTDRRGDPLLGVQRGLSGARALLAHCFSSTGTPSGSVDLRFVARPDGTLDRVRSRSGETAVGDCLATRLSQTHLGELPTDVTRARVNLTLE